MARIFCNPLNVPYKYQFIRNFLDGSHHISREAADPSLISFQGKYYMFASMTRAVWVSEDLCEWEEYPLPDDLPLYDYAPDVRVLGDYIIFSASKRGEICDFYRTKDPINGPYERIPGTFDFWDPNFFVDDDGRCYFYWGCSNATPIWGVELDPETFHQIGEKKVLISGNPKVNGYERIGEDNSIEPRTPGEIDAAVDAFLALQGKKAEDLPEAELALLRQFQSAMPFIEGAWMTKHAGKYYLQHAFPAAEINVYGDAVYVSDSPLGPFAPAENAPYSYKPGGFIPGAGHGSTLEDSEGAWWHTATMRISLNDSMERRVGLWPAGFDEAGNIFCNQRYGDWPQDLDALQKDPFAKPAWMLISPLAKFTASSTAAGESDYADFIRQETPSLRGRKDVTIDYAPSRAGEENVRTWWKAGSREPGEWLEAELPEGSTVNAVQINFADDKPDIPFPAEDTLIENRHIDTERHFTRWSLLGSRDGKEFFTICDKSQAETNLPHDFVLVEEGKGVELRFLKLIIHELPFGQVACVSGLRIFGHRPEPLPARAEGTFERVGDRDVLCRIADRGDAVGCNILWGNAPDKLYHSYMIFSKDIRYTDGQELVQKIGALVKGKKYCFRIDAFNGAGITEGEVVEGI